MSKLIKKNFDAADQSSQPSEKMVVDTIELSGVTLRRITIQPGWKWSTHLGPLVKTDSCQDDHLFYVGSGKMTIRMDDGQELDYVAGDLAAILPGHDGWGSDDEPTVWLDLPNK
jgi:quercetin dioxygenase-like cupin family protein